MIETLALRILKGMSDSLRRAASFTFTTATMRDEVAITGQSLEFYRRDSVTVKRPNKLLIRFQGDIGDGSLWYDGHKLSLLHSPTKFYSQVSAPATIDELLDLLENKFHDSLPIASVLWGAGPMFFCADGD